jgi:radical SAM superfamily enzyme YgiQ (UPF0313 family)
VYLSDIEYDSPLFRPPSEANSLILQITHGCSWNKCVFCEMYTSKQFRIKKHEQILQEIKVFSKEYSQVNKVFLADGDAMVLKTSKLLDILKALQNVFPNLRRVSTYAKPKDLLNKSLQELIELKDAGLNLVYTGLETGDNELLKLINKSESFQSSADGMVKCKKSGIKSSVMIINGLGGKKLSEQHAINSAKLVNEIQPDYLSTLVLSFPYELAHFKKRIDFEFTPLSTIELIEELGVFISQTNLVSTVFRSDHASNYLVLKGILGRDKELLLKKIYQVIQNPQSTTLREEWQRGL